jgi:hypothetical protein
MATMTVPLMMLPYRRTASAMVREISPMTLNGSISGWADVVARYCRGPSCDAVEGHGDEHADGQRRGGGQRAGRRHVAGHDVEQVGGRDEQNSVPTNGR